MINIDFCHNWNSLAGALQGLARFYGYSYTRSQVMGRSTLCFRITASPDLSPYCQVLFDPTAWCKNVAELLGVSLDIGYAASDQSDYNEKLGALLIKTDNSLETGNPVMLFDPMAGEWNLIAGKEGADLLLLGPSGESLLCPDDLSDSELFPMVQCFFASRSGVLEPDRLYRRSLELALKHYSGDSDSSFSEAGFSSGRNAWQTWIKALKEGSADYYGHALNLRMIRAAREDAFSYLSTLAGDGSFKDSHINAAADSFSESARQLLRAEDLFPLLITDSGNVDPDSSDTMACSGFLENARDLDIKAFEELGVFLDQ